MSLVVETKGTDALCPAEQAKTDCGLAHFDALGDDVSFVRATKMGDISNYVYS